MPLKYHTPSIERLSATVNVRLEYANHTQIPEEEINILTSSEYYSIENLPNQLKTIDDFSILGLNTQSIKAKFDCSLVLIEVAKRQDILFHGICIQESWLPENVDLSSLQIDDLRCYS